MSVATVCATRNIVQYFNTCKQTQMLHTVFSYVTSACANAPAIGKYGVCALQRPRATRSAELLHESLLARGAKDFEHDDND